MTTFNVELAAFCAGAAHGWNPSDVNADLAVSGTDNAVISVVTAGSNLAGRSTPYQNSGYVELELQWSGVYDNTAPGIGIGNASQSLSDWIGDTGNAIGFWPGNSGNPTNCFWYNPTANVAWNPQPVPGDRIGLAWNATYVWARVIHGGVPGDWNGNASYDPASNTGGVAHGISGNLYLMTTIGAAGQSITIYADPDTLQGPVPAGFPPYTAQSGAASLLATKSKPRNVGWSDPVLIGPAPAGGPYVDISGNVWEWGAGPEDAGGDYYVIINGTQNGQLAYLLFDQLTGDVYGYSQYPGAAQWYKWNGSGYTGLGSQATLLPYPISGPSAASASLVASKVSGAVSKVLSVAASTAASLAHALWRGAALTVAASSVASLVKRMIRYVFVNIVREVSQEFDGEFGEGIQTSASLSQSMIAGTREALTVAAASAVSMARQITKLISQTAASAVTLLHGSAHSQAITRQTLGVVSFAVNRVAAVPLSWFGFSFASRASAVGFTKTVAEGSATSFAHVMGKLGAVTEASTASLSRVLAYARSLSYGAASVVSRGWLVSKTLAGTTSNAVSILAGKRGVLTVSLAASSAAAIGRLISMTRAATAASVASALRRIAMARAATASSAASLGRIAAYLRTLATTRASSAFLHAYRSAFTLAASAGSTASKFLSIGKPLAAARASAAGLGRLISKGIALGAGSAASFAKMVVLVPKLAAETSAALFRKSVLMIRAAGQGSAVSVGKLLEKLAVAPAASAASFLRLITRPVVALQPVATSGVLVIIYGRVVMESRPMRAFLALGKHLSRFPTATASSAVSLAHLFGRTVAATVSSIASLQWLIPIASYVVPPTRWLFQVPPRCWQFSVRWLKTVYKPPRKGL